jgi:hypothetical protein
LEARKRLRQNRRGPENERAIFDTVLEQRRIVTAAAKTSRQRRRKERIATVPIPPKSLGESPAPSTNVKPYLVEVWDE